MSTTNEVDRPASRAPSTVPNRTLIVLLALSLCAAAELAAQATDAACLSKKTVATRLEFATRSRASKILGRPDDWARQLSAFERGARQRTLASTTTQSFLRFASEAARPWTADEEYHWQYLSDLLSEAAVGLNLRIPRSFMVKTSGLEEFNAAYSRNQSIMLPQGRVDIAGDVRRDFFLLAHELFHLLSSENPAQRSDLYALLGFERFARFEYPVELEGRRLSNPGSHRYEHALRVQTPDGARDVVPVIQSTASLEEIFDLPTDGPPPIFGVIDIVLLPVDLATGDVLRDQDGDVVRYGFGNTDWVSQMLRNSSYIISPEELMADNFALLMEWRSTGVMPTETPSGFPVDDVELLLAMEEVLTAGCAPAGASNRTR